MRDKEGRPMSPDLRVIKRSVIKVSRPLKIHPEIRKHLPSLPVKDGKIVLDRNNSEHVEWMEEEGEEELY